MYKGIYIALSGAVLKNTQMEIISQNLSNAGTVGYKADSLSFKDYPIPQDIISLTPDGRAMSDISSYSTDFSNGNHIYTGSSLDVAIEGSGFIALEGNRYTRSGDLKKDKEGYLTTQNGVKVLGSAGPIRLPEGQIQIDETGLIYVNGISTDSIKIVDFTQTAKLTKIGEGIFTSSEAGIKSKSTLKHKYTETSNVNVIKEMVKMISTLREFETYQKVIQTFDEASSKINNEIGRI